MLPLLDSLLYHYDINISSVSSEIDKHAVELLRNSYFFPILTILLITVYLYRCRARLPAKARYVDPNHVPWFGSLLDVMRNKHRLIARVLDINKLYGEQQSFIWSIPQFSGPKIPIFITIGCRTDVVQYILKTNFNNYIKGPLFKNIFDEFMGNGIFNVDGDAWKFHRKIASHVFTSRNIKNDMTRVFVKNAKLVVDKLNHYADTHDEFDMQDLYFRYTLESFAEIAFGERPGLLGHNDTDAAKWSKSYDIVQALSVVRRIDIFTGIKKLLNIGREKVLASHLRVIDQYAQSVIDKRKNTNKGVLSDRHDLLSRFIAYGIENDEELSDKDLRDIIINFIVAGRDTTAVLLSWATYELTQHPEWEEKILQAIKEHEAKHQQHNNESDESESTFSEYDEVSHLNVIQAFLHEVLRLYPSVPMDNKEAVNDDVLPDGTFVPAGAVIQYSPYIFGRSTKLWGSDALSFNPSRWLDPDSRTGLKDVSQYKFITFNAGPRLCLGKGVALHEAGLIFSTLIKKFKFSVAENYKARYGLSVTLVIKGGLPIRVERREKDAALT